MDESVRFSSLQAIFEDSEVHTSTLALLLNDFETQLGRFSDEATVKDEPIITLDKVLELEEIFKKRAIEALESGSALEKYNGLNFLWILEQIDPDLIATKKKLIVTDEISLVKVLSYCTSHGKRAGRITSKIWQVDLKEFEKFIEIDEAYHRIQTFVTTNNFLSLSQDEQMDIIAFLLTMKENPENGIAKNRIVEESIQKELNKLVSNTLPDA